MRLGQRADGDRQCRRRSCPWWQSCPACLSLRLELAALRAAAFQIVVDDLDAAAADLFATDSALLRLRSSWRGTAARRGRGRRRVPALPLALACRSSFVFAVGVAGATRSSRPRRAICERPCTSLVTVMGCSRAASASRACCGFGGLLRPPWRGGGLAAACWLRRLGRRGGRPAIAAAHRVHGRGSTRPRSPRPRGVGGCGRRVGAARAVVTGGGDAGGGVFAGGASVGARRHCGGGRGRRPAARPAAGGGCAGRPGGRPAAAAGGGSWGWRRRRRRLRRAGGPAALGAARGRGSDGCGRRRQASAGRRRRGRRGGAGTGSRAGAAGAGSRQPCAPAAGRCRRGNVPRGDGREFGNPHAGPAARRRHGLAAAAAAVPGPRLTICSISVALLGLEATELVLDVNTPPAGKGPARSCSRRSALAPVDRHGPFSFCKRTLLVTPRNLRAIDGPRIRHLLSSIHSNRPCYLEKRDCRPALCPLAGSLLFPPGTQCACQGGRRVAASQRQSSSPRLHSDAGLCRVRLHNLSRLLFLRLAAGRGRRFVKHLRRQPCAPPRARRRLVRAEQALRPSASRRRTVRRELRRPAGAGSASRARRARLRPRRRLRLLLLDALGRTPRRRRSSPRPAPPSTPPSSASCAGSRNVRSSYDRKPSSMNASTSSAVTSGNLAEPALGLLDALVQLVVRHDLDVPARPAWTPAARSGRAGRSPATAGPP